MFATVWFERMTMHWACRIFVVAAFGLGFIVPAAAVVILDSTWADNGGSEEAWGEGFGPAIALANEPQFSPVVGLEGLFGDDVHFGCSGTWLGNDEADHAFILTAAHCFNADGDFSGWDFISVGGTRLQAVAVTRHPLYDDEIDETTGYDMAIVELEGAIEDAGETAVLYAGSDEIGYVGTAVGYGTRGTAEYGEDRRFNADSDKAAAHNMIDAVEDAREDGQGGNILRSDFDGPDGQGNTLEGDAEPYDELEGMIAVGDSGGSMWIETEEGWRMAGINAATDTMGGFGMIADFARVSTQLEWIASIFPDISTGE